MSSLHPGTHVAATINLLLSAPASELDAMGDRSGNRYNQAPRFGQSVSFSRLGSNNPYRDHARIAPNNPFRNPSLEPIAGSSTDIQDDLASLSISSAVGLRSALNEVPSLADKGRGKETESYDALHKDLMLRATMLEGEFDKWQKDNGKSALFSSGKKKAVADEKYEKFIAEVDSILETLGDIRIEHPEELRKIVKILRKVDYERSLRDPLVHTIYESLLQLEPEDVLKECDRWSKASRKAKIPGTPKWMDSQVWLSQLELLLSSCAVGLSKSKGCMVASHFMAQADEHLSVMRPHTVNIMPIWRTEVMTEKERIGTLRSRRQMLAAAGIIEWYIKDIKGTHTVRGFSRQMVASLVWCPLLKNHEERVKDLDDPTQYHVRALALGDFLTFTRVVQTRLYLPDLQQEFGRSHEAFARYVRAIIIEGFGKYLHAPIFLEAAKIMQKDVEYEKVLTGKMRDTAKTKAEQIMQWWLRSAPTDGDVFPHEYLVRCGAVETRAVDRGRALSYEYGEVPIR